MTQHYFSASPSGDFVPREIEVELAGATRTVSTAASVFSPDQLDRGTRVLLDLLAAREEQPTHQPEHGPLLDIGCGWGPIALDAALTHPEREVWAIDVNERSRELTEMNARRLGLANLRVAAPDAVPDALVFAEIRSNPPIRVGKQVLHGILETWLPRLAPGASAVLVVAKHLGADSLERWIAASFPELEVARIGRKQGFHVIEAAR